MKPLWKVRSGDFAGWRRGDLLFDSSGKNVGYFVGDLAYSNIGVHLGQIYGDDWVGIKTGASVPAGSSRASFAGVSFIQPIGRVGLAIGGWSDPLF